MKRRLVRQGAATLMISLPSKWIRQNKLDKGDEVNVEEDNQTLIIKPSEEKKTKKEITLELRSSTESSIRTIITSAYRLGFDKLKVTFSDESAVEVVNNVVKNLLGFEIITQTDKEVIIENITEPSKDQFENIFRKVLLNIGELLILAEQSLEGKKVYFEETEQKIIEFDNLCRRMISKDKPFNYQLLWGFHTSLNHAQREIYHLLKYLTKNPPEKTKELNHFLSECKETFRTLKEAYQKKEVSLVEQIHARQVKITPLFYKLAKKEDPIVLHFIMNAIRNFYLASSPLTGAIVSLDKN